MKVVLATGNKGKLKELKEIADEYLGKNCPSNTSETDSFELVLAPEGFDPEETGKTYLENAEIKAREAAKLTGLVSVADDSGLEVSALNGRPGLHSARYRPGSDRDRRLALLEELEQVPDNKRDARFVCCMAVYDPTPECDAVIFSCWGIWNGRIGKQEKGSGGFGYDPIFFLTDRDVTAAELSHDEKNRFSHRGIAWRKVLDFLEKKFMAP